MSFIQSHSWIQWDEWKKGGRDWFWGLTREMIVLGEGEGDWVCCLEKENEELGSDLNEGEDMDCCWIVW